MNEQVGLREFKSHMGKYIRRMKKGEVITLTDRGKVIGRVVPARPSPEECIEELVESGVIVPAGGKRRPPTDATPLPGDDETVNGVVPARPSLEERLKQLADAGLIIPAKGKLPPIEKQARLLGDKTVTDLLIEDRG